MGESVLEPEEREKITRNLGPVNKVMLLTNRGALCCGETVEEAFYNVYNTVLACETQLKLMPVGLENLSLISDEEKKAIYEASRKGLVTPASGAASTAAAVEPSPLAEKLEKRWRIGGTEFEALMRMLDNAVSTKRNIKVVLVAKWLNFRFQLFGYIRLECSFFLVLSPYRCICSKIRSLRYSIIYFSLCVFLLD